MNINKIGKNRKTYKITGFIFVAMVFITLPTLIMPFFFGIFALAMFAASNRLKKLETLSNYRFYEVFNSEDMKKTDFLYLLTKEDIFRIERADGKMFKTEQELNPIQKEYLQLQKTYDSIAPLYLSSVDLSVLHARSQSFNK